eukprot:CAMPEP_0176016284 /NCGR_PEP_ID=MMETSP0120_2-20121206/7770_1 /TAXON_ID=160619 /ORGANISM="Kryptoperidinium foliaceum, Strain CCMP 1326" /LENGTH=197 /DNA_ID=CAMNT_0017349273 /DNA_START=116 /DNA_END=709 /DNA_ORIENTATION=+
MDVRWSGFIFVVAFVLALNAVEAFMSASRANSVLRSAISNEPFSVGLFLSSGDEEDEVYKYDESSKLLTSSSKNGTTANYLDDLTPPPVNFARDSILFSDNPATKRNNAAVEAWSICRKNLPPVFTGTWPWRDPNITERDPLGALYNMFVVRIPTMGIGVVYIKNLVEGHPLVMDFGHGPFEMSPLIVFSVLAFILA